MSNHWLLSIGINQYRHFQPLNYAQADAQALWNYLVGKAGFMPDRCLLFTDSSPFMEGQSTYPTRDNLEKWIDWLCQDGLIPGSPLRPGDSLWCFFSGYGVNWEGQDYLMPIDGNPADISGTGIPMRSLFERLKGSSAATILVLLDMNHNRERVDVPLGIQTIELAREWEVPTVLSCQPSQISHEASNLHHGLFTVALLEGLRSGAGKTLADLKDDLTDRLPSLSETQVQQRQDPVIIVHPATKIYRAILPQSNELVMANGNLTREDSLYATSGATIGATLSPSLIAVRQHAQNVTTIPGSENPFQEALADGEPIFAADDAFEEPYSSTPTPVGDGRNMPRRDGVEGDRSSFWQQMFLWTGGTLLGLLLLFVLGNWGYERFSRQRPETLPSLSNAGSSTPATLSPQQVNQARLERAKILLHNSPVSQLNQAIGLASQIKPGEPMYDEARTSIDRWSRAIWDAAEGRAQKGNFTGAIAAANLIPKNHPIYEQVPTAANQWRVAAAQQKTNKTLLQGARALIRPGQASSYNNAIIIARKVPAGQPVYAESQKAIASWSQTILSLANFRASKGDFKAAIDTASLVPEETPAYAKAQQAIAQWKRQPAKPKT